MTHKYLKIMMTVTSKALNTVIKRQLRLVATDSYRCVLTKTNSEDRRIMDSLREEDIEMMIRNKCPIELQFRVARIVFSRTKYVLQILDQLETIKNNLFMTLIFETEKTLTPEDRMEDMKFALRNLVSSLLTDKDLENFNTLLSDNMTNISVKDIDINTLDEHGLFLMDCFTEELKYRWNAVNTMEDVCQIPLFKLTTKDLKRRHCPFKNMPVLDPFVKDKKRFVLVEGQVGSGKTSLLNYIISQWANDVDDEDLNVKRYKFVHYIDCVTEKSITIRSFLQKRLSQSRHLENKDIDTFFQRLDNHSLYLIDNIYSTQRFASDHLISYLVKNGQMSHMLFAFHPSARSKVEDLIKAAPHANFILEGIKNDKVQAFARDYMGSSFTEEKKQDILKTISNLHTDLQDELRLPRNIKHYIDFIKSTELAKPTSLFTSEIFGNLVARRINLLKTRYFFQQNSRDCSIILKSLLEDLQHATAKTLQSNKISFKEEDLASSDYFPSVTKTYYASDISIFINSFLHYKVTNNTVHLTFSSKLFQEYLAASYYATTLGGMIKSSIYLQISKLGHVCLLLLEIISSDKSHLDGKESNVKINGILISAIVKGALKKTTDIDFEDVYEIIRHTRSPVKVIELLQCKIKKNSWGIYNADNGKLETCLLLLRYIQPKTLSIYSYTTVDDHEPLLKLLIDIAPKRKRSITSLWAFVGSLPCDLITKLPSSLKFLNLEIEDHQQLQALTEWMQDHRFTGKLFLVVPHNIILDDRLCDQITGGVVITHTDTGTHLQQIKNLVTCLKRLFKTEKEYKDTLVEIRSSTLLTADYERFMTQLQSDHKLWLRLKLVLSNWSNNCYNEVKIWKDTSLDECFITPVII